MDTGWVFNFSQQYSPASPGSPWVDPGSYLVAAFVNITERSSHDVPSRTSFAP
jgi:hypothetical protein